MHRRTTCAVLALVAAFLGASGDAGTHGARFVVVEAATGAVALSRPVDDGQQVRLEHTHSVTKRPVTTVFSLDSTAGLAMREMRFDTFGANLPVGPERIGEETTTFLRGEDEYRVLHHDRPLGAVRLMVGGPEVDHTVTLPGGERVRLLELVASGTSVTLAVQAPTPR
ncbi:uncharacterized protein DUF1850 [Haloactinospora alba]|uniref:Uncharacterized protein DUF1850 n=1 Tax=Haloactinospora alba TaxID=405555 RepID=A0A543NGQ4_9ACTN|nr:DUF1850 domain-containing protein [Haloactinospora alba]TQN31036.1 uncharacterized protein DUF1850 [Haloactinospora alba]